MFASMKSRSKPRSPGEVNSKENLFNTMEFTFFSNYHESYSKCLSSCFLGQVQNWVTWSQKLGHQAKSKENLVNTHQRKT